MRSPFPQTHILDAENVESYDRQIVGVDFSVFPMFGERLWIWASIGRELQPGSLAIIGRHNDSASSDAWFLPQAVHPARRGG